MVSASGHRFGEIEEESADVGPGGVFGGRKVRVASGLSHGEEMFGPEWIGLVTTSFPFQGRTNDLQFAFVGGA